MDCDEVRKRKEYAERKVKERHAALRKEAEERRKQAAEHQERVQSVLKREQVLLQKRMQQLNEDEERKKMTLEKQHEAASRIAAITKSPKSFAFGSSTPRTLAYLDNLPKSEQQYDKKLRPLEVSSRVSSATSTNFATITKVTKIMTTPQRPPPTAQRPTPTMTSMTSSMYVTSSAPPSRHAKVIPKSSVTITSTSKRLSHGPSIMTQSVYTPTSRPTITTRSSLGAKPNRRATPSSGRPQSITSTPDPTNNRRSLGSIKLTVPQKWTVRKPEVKKQVTTSAQVPVVVEKKLTTELTSLDSFKNQNLSVEAVEKQKTKVIAEEFPVIAVVAEKEEASKHAQKVEDLIKTEEIVKRMEENLEASGLPDTQNSAPTHPQSKFHQVDERVVENINDVLAQVSDDKVSNEAQQTVPEVTFFAMQDKSPCIEIVIADSHEQKREIDEVKPIVEHVKVAEQVPREIENEKSTEETSKDDFLNEESSESHLQSSTYSYLADEFINFGVDFNESHTLPSIPDVVEFEYPLSDEPNNEMPKPGLNAAISLVDVFGNGFVNENRSQRVVEVDEGHDSGKASPASSETSSMSRSVITEAKIVAPRVLPIIRSAEDMAKKEKEAREAEERKNRLAAILAKSRGMASLMTNALPPPSADIRERGKANDVLARVAAMTNSSTLQKILQRKQGNNPSLQASEPTGGEIY